MIYISIPESQKDSANQWVQDNCDPSGGLNTFTANFTDGSQNVCLISIPNNGSDYSMAMQAQFGGANTMPSNLQPLATQTP